MSDLKPCPFCGNEKIRIKQNFQMDGMSFVVCDKCGAVTSFVGNQQKKETIKMWNNQQLQSELAQVKQQSLESIRHHKDSIQAKIKKIESLEQQLAEAREANRWIPVSERLPEEYGEYLCYCTIKNVHGDFFDFIEWHGDRWAVMSNLNKKVTHWKPITKPE